MVSRIPLKTSPKIAVVRDIPQKRFACDRSRPPYSFNTCKKIVLQKKYIYFLNVRRIIDFVLTKKSMIKYK